METDEEELTLLGYTRYYGLSCDPAGESEDETEDCFNDYIKCSSRKLLVATEETESVKAGLLNEKVVLDAAARTVLSSVFSLQKKPATFGIELDVRQTKKFRLEEPMLFTDAEIDVKHYHAARLEAETDHPINWQSFTITDEEDQDQNGPDSPLQKFTESVKKEKLEVPKEAMLLLKQACAPQDVEKNRIESYELGLKYRRNDNLRPLTPPLSPVVSEPATPNTSSSGPDLDSLKWNTTPPTTDAKRIVNNMLRDDNLPGYWDHSSDNIKTDDLEALYPPLRDRHQPQPLCSSPPRQRTSRLKLEEPLSPWTHPASLPSEDIFTTSLPFFQIPASTLSDDDLRRTFEEIIEPGALRVQSTLRNEKIKAADYTARMKVPDLDAPNPLAPWQKQYSQEEELEELRQLMLPIAQSKLHHWSATKLERDLVWTPFSLNVNIEEDLKDVGGLVERFTKLDVKNCVKTESLTWKPEGLRLLDHNDSDEDELSEVEEEQARPGSSHIEIASEVAHVATPGPGTTALVVPETKTVHERQHLPAQDKSLNFSSLLGDKVVLEPRLTGIPVRTDADPRSVFDAADELDHFMELQGRLVKRQKRDHVPSVSLVPARSIDHRSSDGSASTTNNTPGPYRGAAPAAPPVPLPPLLSPRQIVASPALTTNQKLFRELTKLYPDLDIIERDRAASLQNNIRRPGAASSSPMRTVMPTQPIQHDADIVLSPSTGIALVPIARLHQLPLPGSAPSTSTPMPGAALRAGIQALTNQYSHIVALVVVSEIDLNRLPERDRDAIASLRTFAADMRHGTPESFGTHVQVTCVPSRIAHLAHQLIALIAGTQANVEAGSSFQLMTEETQWEVWLRRAGLNAWVAQILTRGQPVVQGQDIESILWSGLQGFAVMPEEEKIATFSVALEGEGMVRRVSRAVESFLKDYGADR